MTILCDQLLAGLRAAQGATPRWASHTSEQGVEWNQSRLSPETWVRTSSAATSRRGTRQYEGRLAA